MRLYSFTNYYLSSLQHGLQTAHVVGKLFNKYRSGVAEGYFHDWVLDHRTIIIKNGGNHQDLMDIRNRFDTDKNPYPWAYFAENFVSLSNAITAVGIVVPEKFYTQGPRFEWTDWDLELYDLIQRTPLAL